MEIKRSSETSVNICKTILGVALQKIVPFIVTTVRTSDLTLLGCAFHGELNFLFLSHATVFAAASDLRTHILWKD
jgi:hypothetical protein